MRTGCQQWRLYHNFNMPYRYSRYLPGFTFLCDLLLLNLAYYWPMYLSFPQGDVKALMLLGVANLSWVLLSPIFKIYRISRPLLLKDNLHKFFQVLLYHLLVMVCFLYTFHHYGIDAYKLYITYSAFAFMVSLHRFALAGFLGYIRRQGYNCRNILILGDETIAARMTEHFNIHPEYGYDLIDHTLGKDIGNYTQDEITAQLLKKDPDEIFVCYKETDPDLIECLIRFGTTYSVKIKLVSDLILTNSYARIVNYDNLPVLQVKNELGLKHGVRITKRAFDIVFSTAIIVSTAPLLAVIYIITRSTSKGPAYYTQERVGLNGKPFRIVKFRSMYTNAELAGPQLACHNDPRVTPWGRLIRKTRLDELPQFWNVLKGDMSVVGPRPERLHYIQKISERKPQYQELLSIKPGITSIGQVHYGYAENVDQMCERMQYDLLYLQDISFKSDMKLILHTVKVMVQGKGK